MCCRERPASSTQLHPLNTQLPSALSARDRTCKCPQPSRGNGSIQFPSSFCLDACVCVVAHSHLYKTDQSQRIRCYHLPLQEEEWYNSQYPVIKMELPLHSDFSQRDAVTALLQKQHFKQPKPLTEEPLQWCCCTRLCATSSHWMVTRHFHIHLEELFYIWTSWRYN